MGTSNSYKGAGGGKPLIPSWLGGGDDGDSPSPGSPTPNAPPPSDGTGSPPPLPGVLPSVGGGAAPGSSPSPTSPPAGDPKRYIAARNGFTRFVSSGGTDRRSLGRAISHYVSNSSGGSRNAARRMVVSRGSTSRLANILSSTVGGNAPVVLRSLGLERLAGRPIEEVFLGMMDVICPDGGSIDDSIAREAFAETIVDLTENGITDFDTLTVAQVQTILELNVAHAIEARLCNDIGAQAISLPQDAKQAEAIQSQLFEFVERAVADAFATNPLGSASLTQDQVTRTIDTVYEQSYSILASMAEAEVDKP